MKLRIWNVLAIILTAAASSMAEQVSDTDAWYVLGTVQSRIFAAVFFTAVIAFIAYRVIGGINDELRRLEKGQQ
jgi:amino acid transporter